MTSRKSPQTVLVLNQFLLDPQDWKYGYDISRNTGLKSGTLYPLLMRLAERKLLQARWQAAEAGKPPRHMYRLTAGGVQLARAQARSVVKIALRKPAFSGVKT